MTNELIVNGEAVFVDDPQASLLEVLRRQASCHSVKDGCSPQGQCGCCTVLVDGQPRVACVTPARRVAGRSITTLEGLDPDLRAQWLNAFTDHGASQCGFCTPGIIMRLAATRHRSDGGPPTRSDIERALAAHLCRCTGWCPIVEAAVEVSTAGPPPTTAPTTAPSTTAPFTTATAQGLDPGRSISGAHQRATLEGGWPQQVGSAIAAGEGGFAADGVPPGALVALPDDAGGWVVGESLTEARQLRSKVQGRRTTVSPQPPLELPHGDWDLTLRTSWVEPAYLETDASWCLPGGEPANPLANGGAFGGKADSPVGTAARSLADHHGRPVLAVFDREDVVRLGPKRPPIAAGLRADGTGTIRVAATPGIAEAITSVAPRLVVETVDVPGPRTSAALRGAGWVEAAVLLAAVGGLNTITAPSGATASATVGPDGSVHVRVACGDTLDLPVLISYCTGAAHMAIGWVTTEGLSVDPEGIIGSLTIRSFGILRASDTPAITVEIDDSLGDTAGTPVAASEAVFAAVALAAWRHQGLPEAWPTGQPLRSGVEPGRNK